MRYFPLRLRRYFCTLLGWVFFACFCPTVFGAEPMRFLSNGVLAEVALGGRNILSDAAEKNGLFLLHFDGSRVKEVRLENVAYRDGVLRVVAPKGYPRFSLRVERLGASQLVLELLEVEGVPRTRDYSLLFRAALNAPRGAEATEGAMLENDPEELRVYWTNLGARAPGGKGYGAVTLKGG